MVVRNTFIERRGSSTAFSEMRRSHSDSELSGSSGGSQRGGAAAAVVNAPAHEQSTSTSDSLGGGFHASGIMGKGGGKGGFASHSENEGDYEGECSDDDDDTLGFEALQPPSSTPMPVRDAPLEVLREFEQLVADGNVPPEKEAQLRSMLHLVPVDADTGRFTSTGSIGHPNGCKACVFFTNDACSKGVSCNYCHIQHRGMKRRKLKPGKWTRDKIKEDTGVSWRDAKRQAEAAAAEAAAPAAAGPPGIEPAGQSRSQQAPPRQRGMKINL